MPPSNVTSPSTSTSTSPSPSPSTSTTDSTGSDKLQIALEVLSIFVIYSIILVVVAALVKVVVKQRKKRHPRIRSETLSVFDLATVFQNDREPYAALNQEEGNCRQGAQNTQSSEVRAHSYAELRLDVEETNERKSQEHLHEASGGQNSASADKPEPPRKCSTLSGILLSRLGGSRRRNEHSTLNRYLTAQRGSLNSTNDYVDTNLDERRITGLTLDMADQDVAGGKDSFLPEDDNLWERCSNDGSIEHDVSLRTEQGYPRKDNKDSRLSTMSDLLRSSWIGMSSMDDDYSNVPRCESKTSLERIEGVFIPESDMDHPCTGEQSDINQVSQNIIDLIKENFSSKVQNRESDSYDRDHEMNDFKEEESNICLEQVLPEPQAMPKISPSFQNPSAQTHRINSSWHARLNQDLPEQVVSACETLPRAQARPLPPVPVKKKGHKLKADEKREALKPLLRDRPEVSSSKYINRSSIDTDHREEVTDLSEEDFEDDYENMAKIVALKPTSNPINQIPKKVPPPPPPKPKKRNWEIKSPAQCTTPGLSTLSPPDLPQKSLTSSNFLMVTQQLQQKLAMRLPGITVDTEGEDSTSSET